MNAVSFIVFSFITKLGCANDRILLQKGICEFSKMRRTQLDPALSINEKKLFVRFSDDDFVISMSSFFFFVDFFLFELIVKH